MGTWNEPERDFKRKKIYAYCYSIECAKSRISAKTKREARSYSKVEKDVKRNTLWCPDCGDAIVWEATAPRDGQGLKDE